ncbi:MAG: hypothetical protein JKY81_02600 [Colwellia sp.]|nr:hypothetical protein [Colwellia sp.]
MKKLLLVTALITTTASIAVSANSNNPWSSFMFDKDYFTSVEYIQVKDRKSDEILTKRLYRGGVSNMTYSYVYNKEHPDDILTSPYFTRNYEGWRPTYDFTFYCTSTSNYPINNDTNKYVNAIANLSYSFQNGPMSQWFGYSEICENEQE